MFSPQWAWLMSRLFGLTCRCTDYNSSMPAIYFYKGRAAARMPVRDIHILVIHDIFFKIQCMQYWAIFRRTSLLVLFSTPSWLAADSLVWYCYLSKRGFFAIKSAAFLICTKRVGGGSTSSYNSTCYPKRAPLRCVLPSISLFLGGWIFVIPYPISPFTPHQFPTLSYKEWAKAQFCFLPLLTCHKQIALWNCSGWCRIFLKPFWLGLWN